MIRFYSELTQNISQKRREAIEQRKALIRQKIAALVVNKTDTLKPIPPKPLHDAQTWGSLFRGS